MPQNVAIEEIGEVWSFPDDASPESIQGAIADQLGRRKEKALLKAEQQELAGQEPSVLSKTAARSASGIEKGSWMPERVIRGGLDLLGYYKALDAVTGSGTKFQDYNRSWLEYFNKRDQQLTKEDESLGATGFGYEVVEGAARATTELPTQLLGGAAGATVGAPVAGMAATAGSTAGLSQYAQDRGEGKGQLESAIYGAVSGTITGLTTAAFGTTGVESIFRKEGVQGVGRRILSILKEAGLEGAEEAVDQFQQDLLERVARNPDKPIEQSVRDVLLAGSVGSLIGGAARTVSTIAPSEDRPQTISMELREAGAPATAAVVEEINLPLLTAEEIQREAEPLSVEATDAGIREILPEAPANADIRGLAQPSVPRLSAVEAEAGLRETLPIDPTTDIRRGPTEIATTKSEPISSKLVEPTSQSKVKDIPQEQWELLAEDLADKADSFYPARNTGGRDYDLIDTIQEFADYSRKNSGEKSVWEAVRDFEAQTTKPDAHLRKLKAILKEAGFKPEGKTKPTQSLTRVGEKEQGGESKSQPTPKIEGMGGARVKLPNSPQTYTVLETLPQTEVEKQNGEQPMRIKNERTGKEEVVLRSEITEVKPKAEGAKPRRTKADLNKALKDAGLDPSVFPDAKSKKNALERAIAKIEETQKKLRGSRSTLSMGVPKAALDLILEAARLSLKAGNGIAKALEAAMAKARELLGNNFDEDALRGQITDELTKTERKETESVIWTGQQESGSRARQLTMAEQFTENKSIEEVINAVATVAGTGSFPGLSPENIPAVLSLTMLGINQKILQTTSPVELSSLWKYLDRAANLAQQQASEPARQLEANKVFREQLSGLGPLLAFRGLAKIAWARALKPNENIDDPEAGVNNIVRNSGKKATEEVQKDVDSLNVDAALMKAIRDSGINLSTLFMDNDQASQSARRKHLFEQIRQKFPNLSTEQKLKLEKALMDAWEKARLKIFRQQFKKFVGLPEVGKENIMDAVQPELIRQANLGTLDDEAFRAAVAKKLGLPLMDGATAKRMVKLAQEAQAAPEGVLRNKIFAKMISELGILNQFHPFDIARDYWYANALSGTRTWVAVLSSMVHGVTLASQRTLDLALRGNIKAAAQLSWAYVLDVGEGVANAIDVVASGDYTRRAEYGQNIDALLRGKGRLDTLEMMKKHGDSLWKRAIGQTAYARRMIIGLDYISAIATRGSEIIYGSALQKDAQQLEYASRRFNREASKQAKAQAQAELGPNAKWVDVRARQLEILNEGVQQSTIDQATLMGEVVALNAPLIGATGAIHEVFKMIPKAIMAAKIPGTKKSADAVAFGISTVIGSPFIRATLNMIANASNYMPLIGGMNWARANMNPEKLGYLKFLALVDDQGKPLSPQRRNSIIAAQLYGIALAGSAYLLARSGDDDEDKDQPRKFDITGTWKGMPADERKARMAKGERPLSIAVFGRHISYATQPMAGALVVAGNARDMDRAKGVAANPEESLERMFTAMISGSTYIKDLSTLSGMSAMAGWGAMRTDDTEWLNRFFAAQGRNLVTAVVPFASLVREADSWFDPQVYRPKEPLHYWIANVPWMRASAAHGPEYNMAGIPVENYLTPQSRLVAKQPNDPLVVALGQLIENGVTPKYPGTGGWIKDGEKYTPTQQGKLTYRHQVETLKTWREIMLPMKDEIAKMTKEEYEDFYRKELLPVSQEIHDDLQNELDPDVLKRKVGAGRDERKFEKNPRYEMKEQP